MFLNIRPDTTVNQAGATAGSILCGANPRNKGLRLRITQGQEKGRDGPIQGPFVILDVGENPAADALRPLVGRPTDAGEVLRTLRRDRPQAVSVVNTNVLVADGEGVPLPDKRLVAQLHERGQPHRRSP